MTAATRHHRRADASTLIRYIAEHSEGKGGLWLPPRTGLNNLIMPGSNGITWTRAGVKTVLNSSGTVVDLASGQFDPMGWVEAAVTNIWLQSEKYNTTPNQRFQTTVTENNAVAPDGTTTASKILIGNNGTAQYSVFQSMTLAASNYAYSHHVKQGSGVDWIYINGDFGGTTAGAWFNISTGQKGSKSAGTNDYKIETLANGWYRISASDTEGTGAARFFRVQPVSGDTAITFAGDGTQFFYLWGSQNEVGNFATSYIPTTTLAVARVADQPVASSISEIDNNQMTYAIRYYQPAAMTSMPGSFPTLFMHTHETATEESVRVIGTTSSGALAVQIRDAGATVGVDQLWDSSQNQAGFHTLVMSCKSGDSFYMKNNEPLELNTGAFTWNSGNTAHNKIYFGHDDGGTLQGGFRILGALYIPNYAVGRVEARQLQHMLERVAV